MFLAVILALLWLLHRATRLLKVPAPALIQVLGIDIPETPKVVIGSVTTTSVVLQWPSPDRASVVKYFVEVEGIKVAEIERLESSVTLKNLLPNRPYTIKIIAVNPSNYRSHAASIRIHTLRDESDTIPSASLVTGNSTQISTLPSNGEAVTTATSPSSRRVASKSSHKRGRSKAYTVESLTREVELVQNDINEVVGQSQHAEEEFSTTERQLLTDLENMKSRKRTIDQQRGQIRNESKTLEDSKRSLEIQKTKVDKKLARIRDEYDRRTQLQERWTREIDESRQRAAELDASRESIIKNGNASITRLESHIKTRQLQLAALEDYLKRTALNLRRAELRSKALADMLTRIRQDTDHATGIVGPDTLAALKSSRDIDENSKKTLEHEIRKDIQLEEEWQQTQKELEVRYVTASSNYRKAHGTYNEAVAGLKTIPPDGLTGPLPVEGSFAQLPQQPQQPQQPLPQYQQVSYMGMADGPSEYPLNSPETVIAQPVSAPKNRRNKPSTSSFTLPNMPPQTLADNSMGFQGVPYPAAYSPSISSTNGFGPTASLVSTRMPQYSQVPSLRSVGGSMEDGQLFYEDDNPVSPSVDMLLPSNLFGTDDLSESFAAIMNDLPRSSQTRASGGILAEAFGSSSGRPVSFDSSNSPKPSLLSIDKMAGAPSPGLPSSPHGSSFGGFPGGNTIGGYPDSLHSVAEEKKSTSAAKRFGNMFLFGKPKRTTDQDSSLFFKDSDSIDLPSGLGSGVGSIMTDDASIGAIGMRPRAGSISSNISAGASGMGSSNFYNPWKDTSAVSSAFGHDSSSMLGATRSHNGSMLSIDSKAFNSGGMSDMTKLVLNSSTPTAMTPFGGFHLDDSKVSSPTPETSLRRGQRSHTGSSWDMPMLLVSDSRESHDSVHSFTGSSRNSGSATSGPPSAFTTGTGIKLPKLGGLFSIDREQPRSKSESKSIASLFGKSDDSGDMSASVESKDSLVAKENIIQKSMRTLTPRKGSSSSSKFVRRLSLFGKKGDASRDGDDVEAPIAEDDESDAFPDSLPNSPSHRAVDSNRK